MTADIVQCKASPDYTLWIRFADGLEGTVYVSNLVSLSTFAAWRDVRVFMTVRAGDGVVSWPAAGIRLDAEILYWDIRAHADGTGAPKRIAVEISRPRPTDSGFERFMARALAPIARRRRRRQR
jgi:hypothetical protein